MRVERDQGDRLCGAKGLHDRAKGICRGRRGVSLSNYARTAIYLSDGIARSRIEPANNAYYNHWFMVAFQWIIVFIGGSCYPSETDVPDQSSSAVQASSSLELKA
jgi:hypothetical protein